MRMASIASGSGGNCIYVGSGNTNILIDAGISKKRIEEGLYQNDINPKDLNGIFITHEHSDHISGLGVLTRKYPMPIYGTKETLLYIKQSGKLGKLDPDLFCEIEADADVKIDDLTVKPFHISHDALNPVGYRVEDGKASFAIATDLGTYSDYTISNLQGLDILLLEANHDVRMLQAGGYPYQLKQRILSNSGHLSNEMSGRLLCRLLNGGMKKIFLGHLSKENNYEELAYETVCQEINVDHCDFCADDFDITIASREKASRLITI